MRVFQKLTPGGWADTPHHKLANGDVVQVLDAGVPQAFAPDALHGDAKVYVVSQVQRAVTVAVRTASGTRAQDIAFAV